LKCATVEKDKILSVLFKMGVTFNGRRKM
jgi:hypothetical protein